MPSELAYRLFPISFMSLEVNKHLWNNRPDTLAVKRPNTMPAVKNVLEKRYTGAGYVSPPPPPEKGD